MLDREGIVMGVTATMAIYILLAGAASVQHGLVAFLYGAGVIVGILTVHWSVSKIVEVAQ